MPQYDSIGKARALCISPSTSDDEAAIGPGSHDRSSNAAPAPSYLGGSDGGGESSSGFLEDGGFTLQATPSQASLENHSTMTPRLMMGGSGGSKEQVGMGPGYERSDPNAAGAESPATSNEDTGKVTLRSKSPRVKVGRGDDELLADPSSGSDSRNNITTDERQDQHREKLDGELYLLESSLSSCQSWTHPETGQDYNIYPITARRVPLGTYVAALVSENLLLSLCSSTKEVEGREKRCWGRRKGDEVELWLWEGMSGQLRQQVQQLKDQMSGLGLNVELAELKGLGTGGGRGLGFDVDGGAGAAGGVDGSDAGDAGDAGQLNEDRDGGRDGAERRGVPGKMAEASNSGGKKPAGPGTKKTKVEDEDAVNNGEQEGQDPTRRSKSSSNGSRGAGSNKYPRPGLKGTIYKPTPVSPYPLNRCLLSLFAAIQTWELRNDISIPVALLADGGIVQDAKPQRRRLLLAVVHDDALDGFTANGIRHQGMAMYRAAEAEGAAGTLEIWEAGSWGKGMDGRAEGFRREYFTYRGHLVEMKVCDVASWNEQESGKVEKKARKNGSGVSVNAGGEGAEEQPLTPEAAAKLAEKKKAEKARKKAQGKMKERQRKEVAKLLAGLSAAAEAEKVVEAAKGGYAERWALHDDDDDEEQDEEHERQKKSAAKANLERRGKNGTVTKKDLLRSMGVDMPQPANKPTEQSNSAVHDGNTATAAPSTPASASPSTTADEADVEATPRILPTFSTVSCTFTTTLRSRILSNTWLG